MNTFDLAGPLPTGTTLIEASAGTGKTYTIAALSARYIAQEGLDVSDLLMITFGNHAAGELRARVFERLSCILAELDAQIDGRTPQKPADPVAELLAGEDAELHRGRLEAALDRFNEATILTTHSFCQAMLKQLGILGDWDPAEEVGPDPADLVRQCTADTYLRLYRHDPEPPISPRDALNIGKEACQRPLPLLPHDGKHREFAEAVRELYAQRKAAEGICTFDDVTARLRVALGDVVIGNEVAATLRSRYPVVLVDEFQDTDPDQWAIIAAAFVQPDRTTVLIGDPKQSIYGFRGADLGSYLAAKAGATVTTLGTNFRTDKPLVDAVVALFDGTPLGHDDVLVHPVESKHTNNRLNVPPKERLWVRQATASKLDLNTEAAIAADVVRQVGLLLEHATLEAEPGQATKRVRPSDIAILVRTGARGRALRAALSDAGYPAVLTGGQSVWRQPAAAHWRSLLRALDDPTQSNIRLAALTPLIGSDLSALFGTDTHEPARVSTLVREMAQRFAHGGVSGVLDHLRTHAGLDKRVLAEPDGERQLADLTHVAELLHAEGALSLTTLAELCEERSSADEDSDTLRVATDEPAIRVMTIHAAKGLEFPIVLLPETRGTLAKRWLPFTVVDDDRRHLYVGPTPGFRDPLAQELAQQTRDEELRLLYVAFTRAQHLAIAWHVDDDQASSAVRNTPLATLLKRSRSTAGDLILDSSFEQAQQAAPTVVAPRETPDPQALRVAPFTRVIDQTWRRTSYSGLTSGLHESSARMITDELADVDVTPVSPVDPALQEPSPMATLPAGAAFGTLVHEVLERLDWSAQNLHSGAHALMAELGPIHGLERDASTQLAEALVAVCQTPLSPLTTEALTDVPLSHRLPELDFDLPLADSGVPATLTQLADLMAKHLDPSDPMTDYPHRLRVSEAADTTLNGFLTGSIDAVLKLGDGRFVVVDYKTNRLAPTADDALVLGHYTPAAMAEAMMQAHYPLQAILYCAALHRHLSARLAGYSPERHLGGAGYLFVRGMAGAQTPTVDGASCGVMGWFPPAALVVAVSDLLGGVHA